MSWASRKGRKCEYGRDIKMGGTVASKLNTPTTSQSIHRQSQFPLPHTDSTTPKLLLQVSLALSKIVNFPRLSTLPLVALGVLTSQVTAEPAVAEVAEVTTRFWFSEWVDSIIADPSTALSPQEAVQAYLDTANATLPATSGAEKRGWDAQVICDANDGRDRVKVSSKLLSTTQVSL